MKKITLLLAVLCLTVLANAQTQLVAPSISAPTVATSSGFTANWSTVTNALSYNVKIYLNGTSSLVTNKVIYGQTTATLAMSGLTGSTAYQCSVTALGDGVSYSNSPESPMSASISTLAPTLVTALPTANTASSVTSTGFSGSWALVTGATGYTITVYDALSNIVFYTPSLSSSTTTAAVTGLNAATNYTYTVTATGDASTATTSAPVAVTTLAATALSTPTGLAVATANIKATVFTASWTATTGAISYDVKVYNAGNLVSTTNSITTSVLIGGLTPATAYTVKVTAKANLLTNLNSLESASVGFTTNASGSLSTPLITINGATRIGTYGFTANWDAAITSSTSYLIKVYQGSTLVNATYAPGAAITKSVIGANLSPNTAYTYTVSAIAATSPNFESVESAPSPVFTTQIAGYAMQYADTTGLKNEIKYGIADVYELTSSGSTYQLALGSTATGLIVSRGFTLRAQTGLAAKPIFTYNNTSTGSSSTVFSTTTPGLNISFENLELSGVNVGNSTQSILFTATNITTWATVAIKNCKVYNFLNATSSTGGNGILRIEGPSSIDGVNKSTVTLLNSTFDNCGGRFIHLYNPSVSSYVKFGAVLLSNCTFSNFTGTTGNPNAVIFYRTATQKALATSLTVDHCTFYGFNSSNNIITVQNQSPGGPITMTSPILVKNSIFDCGTPAYAMTYTNSTGNTTIFDNSWTSNFSTPLVPAVNALFITNPFVASPVPTYTSVSTKDFTLSNKSSFICTDGYVAGNTFGVTLSTLAAPSTINDASGMTSSSFIASWSAVSGATGYLVNVYNGTTIVASSRVSVANGTLSGLAPNTTYTYKVIAIGDGTNFSSSVESAASSTFSTSVATAIINLNGNSFITTYGKTIISSEIGMIQVYNLQGAKMLEVQSVSKLNTNLACGIYLVKLTTSKGQVTNAKVLIR